MYDIAVIGGGPGGYVAAIRAAQLGAKVLLVEKEKLGGVCLNRGCIPTKTLLNSAEKWLELKKCEEFGLRAENIGYDFAAIMGRKEKVVAQLQAGVVQLVVGNGITVRQGTAMLQGNDRLTITDANGSETLKARRIIIATGSSPFELPIPGIKLPGVISSDEALFLDSVPRSIGIIGAGAVGVEFATVFNAFGAEVTLVEMAPTILPNIDADLVKRMALVLRKQGVKMLTGTKVMEISQGAGGLVVHVASDAKEQEFGAQIVMCASGRQPNVSEIGLEELGVAYDRKGVKTNARMETNILGIYAIGDVTGKYMWAHAASAEGLAAAENALGGNIVVDYTAVPGCIFTDPEIATVGLTEEEAIKAGRQVKVGRFNFNGIGKAVAMGKPDGMVKIIVDSDTDTILGMHILGPHASDLIMEGVVAVRKGLTVDCLKNTIHPHPTLAEAVSECIHNTDGLAIHQVRLSGNRKN